ncbi:MAG TPA: hypothetical protein VN151_06885 [Terracidiphilus sp.]|nr:hypothetical protein [Terracidiphilus sp.]
MGPMRGMLLIVAGAAAWARGFVLLHRGHPAWLAIGLGAAAIGLGVWHLTRRRD